MIAVTDLSRDFGGRRAVTAVTFSVEPGEVVGLLGPNGAGKTTTLRMVLGLLRPKSGSVRVDGPIGYLPEAFVAYDALGVRSYLRHMARMKKLPTSAADDVLTDLALTGLARRPVGRLSKGQRQRVGLAQALLGRPPGYLLDEPTQSLDPVQGIETRELIRSLAKHGAAVLVSTHVLPEAVALCDRVVVLVQGRVIATERPGDVDDFERHFVDLVRGSDMA